MTFLQKLGPGSTLIAPAYLHAALREELLKTRSGMLGLKLNTAGMAAAAGKCCSTVQTCCLISV